MLKHRRHSDGMCSRMDKPKAITAAAHKLARLIYTMLTKGEEYTDQGRSSMRIDIAPALPIDGLCLRALGESDVDSWFVVRVPVDFWLPQGDELGSEVCRRSQVCRGTLQFR